MSKFTEDRIKELEGKKGIAISDEQKDAIREYYGSLENEIMYCPVCRKQLEVGDWFTYDDVCGESSSPKYSCTTEGCDCCTSKSFWTYSGDFFGGDMPYHLITILFPDDQYGALGSHAKSSEVEIYGRGLKRNMWGHPAMCLWLLSPYIEFKYKGDNMGNVLGRTWKLKFLKYDKQQKRYCNGYTSGIHMLIFSLKSFRRDRKDFLERKTAYATKEFLENYESKGWDKRWWNLLSKWYFNNFWDMQKKNALNIQRIWDILKHEDIEEISKELGFTLETIINFLETSSDEKVKEYKELAQKFKAKNEEICQLKKKLLKK